MANKPEPLFIEGHYHFTLSSYDPVQITITVPHISEREVEAELNGALRSRGHAGEDAPSDEWVAEHFEGIESLSALRDVRAEVVFVYAFHSRDYFFSDDDNSLVFAALADELLL